MASTKRIARTVALGVATLIGGGVSTPIAQAATVSCISTSPDKTLRLQINGSHITVENQLGLSKPRIETTSTNYVVTFEGGSSLGINRDNGGGMLVLKNPDDVILYQCRRGGARL